MVGPDGYFHRWTAPWKIFEQREMKINGSTKSLVKRLCDLKIYAISVLSFTGSVCALEKATPHDREPCTSVHYSKTVQRFSFSTTWGLLRLWTWSWFGRHPVHQFGGSVSSCGMIDNAYPRPWESQCGTRAQLHSSLYSVFRLGVQIKTATPWRIKMNLLADFVSIGEPFSKHVRKARGTFNMKRFCDLFSKLLMTSSGLLMGLNLMTSWLQKKDSAPGPDGIPYGVYRCADAWVRSYFEMLIKPSWKEVAIPDWFAESRTIFTTLTSDIDDLGRIIRSPDVLHPLTLCNCDCELSYIGYWSYTIPCIQPSQRWICTWQMTYNIFEIDTSALAHVACAPQESGVLLTDFAAAFPSVHHSWIFPVLESNCLFASLCHFLRSIYKDSVTHVEFAAAERGQFSDGQLSTKMLSRHSWTVRNSSLFLADPTYGNKCMTSTNAQCSSRSGFRIFKISRKIWVWKQSQSSLFCSITHMTILSVFTCMMNMWNQSIQAFVTSFGPFCYGSCELFYWP